MQTVIVFILAATVPWVSCETKSYRINIDILTADYLKAEKTLWTRLASDKEIRVNLLPEIYETHRNALTKDFGEGGAVWELGIRMHENIITNIIGINGTASNLQHALQNKQYDGAIAIAESAVNKTVDAAQALYQITSQRSFWSHISVNVSSNNHRLNAVHSPFNKLFCLFDRFLMLNAPNLQLQFQPKANLYSMCILKFQQHC